MDRIPIVVLVGPTASGKTDLLLRLFGHDPSSGRRQASLPEAELVSADSMQAYRGMDIGTAKPGPAERALLPHHLIDLREPDEQYTVGDFVRLADEACARIFAAGHLPVVCGGTGFYVRNFIFGLPGGPAADPAVREAVARDLERGGEAALRAELSAADPASAARIHRSDLYRLSRAVELLRQTGKPPSGFLPATEPREGYDFLIVEATRSREELRERIDARVDAMFEAGLAAEVAGLVAKGYGPGAPGMQAIGYSEFLTAGAMTTEVPGGSGGLPEGRLREVAEAIKLDTRRYAKRQETFFRGLAGRRILPLQGGDGTAGGAVSLASMIASFLEEARRRGTDVDRLQG
jgi:tRNA dimethylallyltransferase